MTNADRIQNMTDYELCKFLDLLEEGVISYGEVPFGYTIKESFKW